MLAVKRGRGAVNANKWPRLWMAFSSKSVFFFIKEKKQDIIEGSQVKRDYDEEKCT